MADAVKSMVDDLRNWSILLCRAGITAEDLVAAIGVAEDGGGPNQISVRTRGEAWARAEILQGSESGEPDHVRLQPAAGSQLTASDLEEAFGAPATMPPKIHFDDPERRIYEIDSGEATHTVALIAELPSTGGDSVQAVVLRRDVRLD